MLQGLCLSLPVPWFLLLLGAAKRSLGLPFRDRNI